MQYHATKHNDAATEPHEITHGPDALRYFAIYWVGTPTIETSQKAIRMQWTQDMLDDYYDADDTIKERMVEKYGAIQ